VAVGSPQGEEGEQDEHEGEVPECTGSPNPMTQEAWELLQASTVDLLQPAGGGMVAPRAPPPAPQLLPVSPCINLQRPSCNEHWKEAA